MLLTFTVESTLNYDLSHLIISTVDWHVKKMSCSTIATFGPCDKFLDKNGKETFLIIVFEISIRDSTGLYRKQKLSPSTSLYGKVTMTFFPSYFLFDLIINWKREGKKLTPKI